MLNNMINNISNFTEEMHKSLPANFPIYNGIKNFFIVSTTVGSGFIIATVFVSIHFKKLLQT